MIRSEQLAIGITMHMGDMLEIMPTLGPVAHVICDPPYEDELHKAICRIRRNDGREMINSLGFEGINTDRAAIAKTIVENCDGWVWCSASPRACGLGVTTYRHPAPNGTRP
jgi:hypothetical protein